MNSEEKLKKYYNICVQFVIPLVPHAWVLHWIRLGLIRETKEELKDVVIKLKWKKNWDTH